MQSRCCWPPERPEPGLSRRSLTSFHRFAPRSEPLDQLVGVALDIRLLLSRSPAMTLSRIDIVGNGLGRWKTMPIWRRTTTGSTPGP